MLVRYFAAAAASAGTEQEEVAAHAAMTRSELQQVLTTLHPVAPPGEKFGRYAQPHVRFGVPLDFSRFEGMSADRFVLRSITDEIMYELMLLSGQEYVDEYAASRKKSVAEKARTIGEGAVHVAKEIQGSATSVIEEAASRLPRKSSDADRGKGDAEAVTEDTAASEEVTETSEEATTETIQPVAEAPSEEASERS